MIDSTLETVRLAGNLHVHLIEVPPPVHDLPKPLRSALLVFPRQERSEPVPPIPHRLVVDVDASLIEQILDVPQGEREADVHHNHQADDLR